MLRFLKIITPLKCVIPLYDGYVYAPKEGELHRRATRKGVNFCRVWSVDIDRPKVIRSKKGLQFFRSLWDT